MMFALLLLSAVSGHTLGSTIKPLQEMSMEDAVLSLSKQMSDMEEKFVEEKKKNQELSEDIKRVERNCFETSSKLSDFEKSSKESIDDVSNKMLLEKNKLLLMDNHLLFEVHQLQKRERETFEKMVNLENEVSRDRVTTDLLQIQLTETANMTHSCLASQKEMEETTQKNIERLDNGQSNLSVRMGNVENSFETLKKDLDSVSNRTTLKLTVQNNTNDIGLLKKELSRIQTICNPPCENGGQCVKNVCNCMSFFTGDRCQEVVCSPPCENGGQCMRNNVCKCAVSFSGDRCQDGAKCGVDFENAGNSTRENISNDLVWPWMAAVYINETSGPRHVCGGSVIHRHFVLTYAGCVIANGGVGLSVKLGLSNLKTGTPRQEYRVQSAHPHPQFRHYENYDYSIALLELEDPILFGPFVRPVCLPPREIPQRDLLYQPQSTGKGVYLREYISSPQTASPTMLNLTIRSQEECRRKLKEISFEKYHPSPELSFCAEISSTTCPYYGSPLMQSRLAGEGIRTWTQVGIRDFCHDKYVFSPRLDHLMAWVDATIASSSKQ